MITILNWNWINRQRKHAVKGWNKDLSLSECGCIKEGDKSLNDTHCELIRALWKTNQQELISPMDLD